MKKINWVHKIPLRNNFVTPGEWDNLLEDIDIDFRNKRVLDVGCLDGQYTFYAEKKGAREVVSIDLIEKKKVKGSYPQSAYTSEGYLYAHKKLKSRAKYIFPFSIYDVTKEQFGEFDIVLFLGVLYHLAHPLYAFEVINRILKKNGTLVFETERSKTLTSFYRDFQFKNKPKVTLKKAPLRTKIKARMIDAAKILGSNSAIYNKDSSIFWVPTKSDLEKFIDFSGFKIYQVMEDPTSNRITYIVRKMKEPDPTYAVRSKYTTYKNRNSTL